MTGEGEAAGRDGRGRGRRLAQRPGDAYDRWTLWDKVTEAVTTTYPGRAMGSAHVVDPARWGRGCGRAALLALARAPELADVAQFVLGIEPDNTASLRVAAAAGYR